MAATTPSRRATARSAVASFGAATARTGWGSVPGAVRDRLAVALTDLLGVTYAGAATAEQGRLRATATGAGTSSVLGSPGRASLEGAIWLNGSAACCLELDEGNKLARGHPLAHVAFAALAVAEERHATGPELGAALLAGYEVAARFGAATTLADGVHPHGSWGATGAAAAVARLQGGDAGTIAAAIDAASALVLATPFRAALVGNEVRDSWIGLAGQHGLTAARLAAAGRATVDGAALDTLGGPLGVLDVDVLGGPFGSPWAVERGYLKRHACCAFTHPPADAVLELRAAHGPIALGDVAAVEVATNRLAAPLAATAPATRLAAMFSIPYVVATVLAHGDAAPVRFDDAHRADADVLAAAERVEVRVDPDLDAALPAHRPCRVTVTLRGGRRVSATVPDAVGDADNRPLGAADVRRKLDGLAVPGLSGARVASLVDALLDHDDVADVLADFPTLAETTT